MCRTMLLECLAAPAACTTAAAASSAHPSVCPCDDEGLQILDTRKMVVPTHQWSCIEADAAAESLENYQHAFLRMSLEGGSAGCC